MADEIMACRETILAANDEDLTQRPKQRTFGRDARSPYPESGNASKRWPRASGRSPPCPIPLAKCIREWTPPNGLRISKVRVPIGVVGIIYESRPNVTSDAAVLCTKTGNATILRGGSEAIHSNLAIAAALQARRRKSRDCRTIVFCSSRRPIAKPSG